MKHSRKQINKKDNDRKLVQKIKHKEANLRREKRVALCVKVHQLQVHL
jgi:hypothetical protein